MQREFKTFSVDAMRKPGLPVYLNTYSMEMNYSPRYFPDGDIKNNYSGKLLNLALKRSR